MAPNEVRIPWETLQAFTKDVFVKLGMPPEATSRGKRRRRAWTDPSTALSTWATTPLAREISPICCMGVSAPSPGRRHPD